MDNCLTPPKLPKLPLGQHTFRKLRERGFLYIDKTDLVLQLIEEGDGYFLNRPRRMGKSLLISVLEALFEGRRELFEGLAIADSDYDFKPYPVIRLDFGSIAMQPLELYKSDLCDELRRIAAEHGLPDIKGTIPSRLLINLVTTLAEKEQVVLLIDEYDQPIQHNLETPEQTRPYLDFLKSFYTVVKSLQPYLRFTFVTGVSRFSKTTIFSGMNHLKDLSLRAAYAALLGITEEEITQELLPWVRRIAASQQQSEAEIRELMRCWYNGYRFAGEPTAASVYNPHSLFSFLEEGKLVNYWFSTGTPSFILDLIRQEQYPVVDFEAGVTVFDSELRDSFDADHIDLITLLYQTGYLTISHYDATSDEYTLHFPNEEVRRSFFKCLSPLFFGTSSTQSRITMKDIAHGLRTGDVNPIIAACNLMLGQLSHHLQRRDEAYYHSLAFVMLSIIGFPVEAEKSGCKGRLDMSLRIGNRAYILEFKRDSSAAAAMRQIHEKQYARAYAGKGLQIYLVGINVNSTSCSIDDWIVERAQMLPLQQP